jgi:hypothetical protein
MRASTTPTRQTGLSVRGLMLLVLVMGGSLGWYIRDVRLQRAAVAAVERARGRVAYEWQYKGDEPDARGEPWAPDWLRKKVGVDYLGSVVAAGIRDDGTDAELAWIGKLSRLQRLTIRGARVTGAGFAHLEGISGLRALYLHDMPISDAALAHLNLTRVRWLSLEGTNIGDTSLARLKQSAELEFLSLKGTKVTDAGLVHLERLMGLTGLSLEYTMVSDAGLAHLRGLTRLEKLWLRGSKVSAQGTQELRRVLPKLTIGGVL